LVKIDCLYLSEYNLGLNILLDGLLSMIGFISKNRIEDVLADLF